MNQSLARTAANPELPLSRRPVGLRAWILSRWFERLAFGRLSVEFPSGKRTTFKGVAPGPQAAIRIRDLKIVNRLISGGDLGLAEAYMAGEWESPDLSALLHLGMANADVLDAVLDKTLPLRLIDRIRHAAHGNSRRGSRRNIAAHYDLGNEFYERWLDPSMTYSAGLFAHMDEDHTEAQRRKYLRLAAQLELRPGDRVLEIGCGWGGFAEIAAKEFGCHVTALTLSTEQAEYARRRVACAGLAERVDVRLQDYRDVTGRFDKIASIEMFEAVGEKYWPVYFDALRRLLTPTGRAALQIITIDDARFEAYRRNPDFIQRYIFPGGMLPGPKKVREASAAAGLTVTDHFTFGASYAESLRRWDKDFQTAWPAITALGFDERFFRMWRYYLCYCEVGFDRGVIDVAHFTLCHA